MILKFVDIIFLLQVSVLLNECMHVHASDKRLSEAGSAKFFVKGNGDTELMKQGTLNDLDVRKIQGFIKEHYVEMYDLWSAWSDNGYYRGK